MKNKNKTVEKLDKKIKELIATQKDIPTFIVQKNLHKDTLFKTAYILKCIKNLYQSEPYLNYLNNAQIDILKLLQTIDNRLTEDMVEKIEYRGLELLFKHCLKKEITYKEIEKNWFKAISENLKLMWHFMGNNTFSALDPHILNHISDQDVYENIVEEWEMYFKDYVLDSTNRPDAT